MAFVDVTIPYATADASGSVGGGTVGAGLPVGVPLPGRTPGGGAPGTNIHVRNWILVFYVLIGLALISAGVIFNGKG